MANLPRILLGATLLGIAPGQVTDAQSAAALQTTNKKIPAADLHALSEAEVRALIQGRTVKPDPHSDQIAHGYIEKFLSDGKWESWRERRTSVKLTGRWTIDGSKICVAQPQVVLDCRDVFVHIPTNSVVMEDLGDRRLGLVRVVIF